MEREGARMQRIVIAAFAVLTIMAGVSLAEVNIEGGDIVWQHGYEAVKLPSISAPRFGRNNYPGKGAMKVRDGVLTISVEGDGKTNQLGLLHMSKLEWGNTPASTIEVRLRIVEQIPGTLYAANMRARSNKKAFGIFFSSDKVAIGRQSSPVVCTPIDATEFHVYRFTLEADAVKLYLDGGKEPVLTLKPSLGIEQPLVEFGAFLVTAKSPSKGLGGVTEWDYIRWNQRGAFKPGHADSKARIRVATQEDKRVKLQTRLKDLSTIADPAQRAARAVELSKDFMENNDAVHAAQILRRTRAYMPDDPGAMDALGFAKFGDRWVSKKSLPLWRSGKIEHSLRVMTFNLLRDLRRDADWLWVKRQPLVAAVINDYQPDLVGIQEVIDEMLDPLMPVLPGYTLAKMPCTPALRRGSYAGEFIYRTERFELLDKAYFIFPPYDPVTGEYVAGKKVIRRGGMMIVLRDKISGKTVCGFSSHVAHGSREANLASCKMMKERLLKLPEDALVFVMGDFNIGRRTPSWNVLATGERAMSDARALAMQKSISGNRNDGIDWMTFYPKTLPVLFYGVVRYTAGNIRGSDHDAVYAEFGFE